MARRGSVSSTGSGRPGGLQRRDSGGSMTDRTFRDPSPSRNNQPVYYDEDAPPVPALPNRYMSPPPVPLKSIRRPASVEPPERVLSPPPRPNGRGVSLDRGPGMMAGNRKGKPSKPAGNLQSVGEATRGQARDTVNFSRPMSPTSSPPSSPILERRIASPPPGAGDTQRSNNTANVGKLRDGEAENIQYSLQETAAAPVKKKKKKATANPEAAGSHLAAGTSGGRASGTAVESTPQRQPPSVDTTPSSADSRPLQAPVDGSLKALPKKKKKVVSSGSTQAREPDIASCASDSDSAVSERSNISDRPRTYNTRAAGLLFKQPSIVREDREGEEIAESGPPKTINGRIKGNGNANTGIAEAPAKSLGHGRLKSQNVGQEAAAAIPAKATSLDIPRDLPTANGLASAGVETTNRQSLSPSRAAHFSAQPIYETPDGVKHQPPARSVSPAKSALKHSPSRGASPVTGIPADSTRRRGPASEASDTTSVISEDGFHPLPKKKKNVRVSFDNESTVVGRAATPPTDPDSPVVMSPQAKGGSSRRWLPFAKDKNQHASSPSKDEDNIIQPTPVLPSFGSVRGRNEHDPRTAVTNHQHTVSQTEDHGMGASSDQRIGNILSRVFAADEPTSMTNPAEREASTDPLPPQTTSVEGSGYHSDTEGNFYSEQDRDLQTADTSAATGMAKIDMPGPKLDAPTEFASEPITGSPHTPEQNTSVPSIAVQPATPRPDQASTFATQPVSTPSERAPTIEVQPATPATEEKQVTKDYYRVHLPGEFPVSFDPSDDDQQPSMPSIVQHRPTDLSPAAVGIAEPEPPAAAAYHDHSSPVIGGLAEGLRLQTAHDADEESEDTNHSIYSDAAEDISDLEGDGFGSINAIVESPAVSPQVLPEKQNIPESPTKGGMNGTRMPPSLLARNDSEISEPGPDAGWEQAQQYWSGLSQQRKQQMEQAAARKIAEEESKEELKPKPKKKKMVPKKPAQPPLEATETSQTPLPPWPDRQDRDEIARSSSPKASAMKKSMRASQNESLARPPTAMKKSMRGTQNVTTEEPTMRSSMRNQAPSKPRNRMSSPQGTLPEPRDDLQKKQRPVSAINMMDYNKPQGKMVVKHDRAVSLGGPSKPGTSVPATPSKKRAPVTKPLQRNDSDSSSSFKRARTTPLEGGKYTMKRSMRGDSVDEQPQSTQGRSMSLTNRTASPAGSSRRPFSTAGSVGPTMRTSMRGSIDSAKRAKSPPRSFGFGKSKPKATSSAPKSRLSSRFGDSSDEEDGAVNRRSRFADSSDEDEPDFTPVRGIPRRIDEGDSTDLEDSSDEKVAPKPRVTQPQTSMSEGKALGAKSLRPVTENATSPASPMNTGQQPKDKEKKKRSFFGGLGGKKPPRPEPVNLSTEGQPRQDILRTKADQVLGSPTPISPIQPSSPNITSNISASPQAKKSPKLQRRISAQQAEKIQMNRGMSDSWPLPQSPRGPSTPTMRPSTSDGTPKKKGGLEPSGLGKEVIAEEARPGLGTRNDTANTAYTNGVEAVAAVGQKKKKGWLRKAFGR